MNNKHAKNNLGFIYLIGDGCQKDIYKSIEYFEEAIKIGNDPLSTYNLAMIYFFGENKDLNRSIFLLIQIFNTFQQSHYLLILILIKKIGFVTLDSINDEIQKYDKNYKEISKILHKLIKESGIERNSLYNDLYKKIQNVYYLYNYGESVISSTDFMTAYNDKIVENPVKIRNSQNALYLGFDI